MRSESGHVRKHFGGILKESRRAKQKKEKVADACLYLPPSTGNHVTSWASLIVGPQ
jgi:hypothetical protein